jgi:signal transduction histidine kinase
MGFFEKLARELMNNNASSHQLRFSCRSNQMKIISDEKLLRQIVANLLTNAVKFSPGASEVAMKVVCAERNLLISIKDFGIGILPEELKNLFMPFSRASNAIAIEGTGLGLSIVKTSVELLKGKIMVNSLPGHGTTFKIVIPLEKQSEYADKTSMISHVSKLES